MTKELYLWCGVMYLIGQLFHFFVIKIPTVKKRTIAANKHFSFKEYMAEDWYIHIGNMLFGVACVIGVDQFLSWKPDVLNVIKWLFFFVGISGSSIGLALFSAYEKTVLRIIDVKTNVADSILPVSSDQAAAIGKASKNAETQVEAVSQITDQNIKNSQL